MTSPAAQFTPPIQRRNHGRGHSYRDAVGRKVPGVTTILKAVAKPALIGWAARAAADSVIDRWDELTQLSPSERHKLVSGAPNANRDAAAIRGTRVHNIADKISQGQDPSVPEELRGHVESHVRFLDEWDVITIASEFVVVNNVHGYAGTGDLFAWLRDPNSADRRYELWLIDAKTNKGGVYGETALQLAAYGHGTDYYHADGHRPFERPPWTRSGVLHIRADGYDLVPVEAGPEQFRAFLYVQQQWRWMETSRDLVGDALLPPPELPDDAPCSCGSPETDGWHRIDAECEIDTTEETASA